MNSVEKAFKAGYDFGIEDNTQLTYSPEGAWRKYSGNKEPPAVAAQTTERQAFIDETTQGVFDTLIHNRTRRSRKPLLGSETGVMAREAVYAAEALWAERERRRTGGTA